MAKFISLLTTTGTSLKPLLQWHNKNNPKPNQEEGYVVKFVVVENRKMQASTLTCVRLSSTSENWRRKSRSCITVVRWDKRKNQIPKRAGTTDKSISTGKQYWVCFIKEPCLISDLSIKWNARSNLFYCNLYHLLFLHTDIWSSRTLTQLKSQSQGAHQ